MVSEEDINNSIENKIIEGQHFSVEEIKYLLRNHIKDTYYDDTVVRELNDSSLIYIEELERKIEELNFCPICRKES